MEDEKIIELFLGRSENAISALEEKFGSYCRTVAKNILRNDEDTEECLNDAYLAIWNRIPPAIPENLKAFFGKITHNLAIRRLRKRMTKKRGEGIGEIALSELEDCIPENGNPEKAFESKEITKIIERFLYSNPLEKRNIFIRRYWYMCSVSEIAEAYGFSESKVKSILFRMRNELRKELEKEGFFCE